MTRLAILIALIGILVLASPATGSAPTRCAEDDPCWNCHTMGNLICGP